MHVGSESVTVVSASRYLENGGSVLDVSSAVQGDRLLIASTLMGHEVGIASTSLETDGGVLDVSGALQSDSSCIASANLDNYNSFPARTNLGNEAPIGSDICSGCWVWA